MMNKNEILNFLVQNKNDMKKRFSVKRIGLFGSFVRGSQHGKSDVDILVEFENPTFDNYMDLKFYLERNIGRPVDLVLVDSLKPRIRNLIIKEVAYA
ncbi:MAG: nucleotidyltransferase family protein [Deltaproteobacteria bacterium]|nr:nucleotidyltransferase family protein [Deltaproteobacteria bacterium]